MLTVGSSAIVTAAHQYFAFWLLHICGAFFVGLPVKPAMTGRVTTTGGLAMTGRLTMTGGLAMTGRLATTGELAMTGGLATMSSPT